MKPNELASEIRNNDSGPLSQLIRESLFKDPELFTQSDEAGVPIVHLLALSVRLAEVKDLLTVKMLECVWGPGWTVPHVAAQTQCIDAIVDQLAAHKHLLHWGDESGNTPVHLAARNGTLHLLTTLLEDPSLLAQPNSLLQTPVHIAALNSNLHQIEKVLTPELLSQRDIQNQPAYKVAERSGQIFKGNQTLEELVRQAKILLGEERKTYDDVLNEIVGR